MPTKLYSANVHIGPPDSLKTLLKIAVKKLPLHILMADNYFMDRIAFTAFGAGEPFPKAVRNPRTKQPIISIEYIQYLGDVSTEPEEL